MLKLMALASMITLSNFYGIAQLKPVDEKSTVKFAIRNFGFNVKGSFTGLRGLIYFDPQTPDNSSMDITIAAGTVNTDNALRDKHLKDEKYFDVNKYPTIHFLSGKILRTDKTGNYIAVGKLTIKGKSKDISIPFSAMRNNGQVQFKGSFKINRKDFGVGGFSTIANELEVELNVIALKA